MGRSVKKGPYVQPVLLARVQKMNESGVLTVSVHIASCLDPSGYKNTHALAEILLRKLSCPVKGHAGNKIR